MSHTHTPTPTRITLSLQGQSIALTNGKRPIYNMLPELCKSVFHQNTHGSEFVHLFLCEWHVRFACQSMADSTHVAL